MEIIKIISNQLVINDGLVTFSPKSSYRRIWDQLVENLNASDLEIANTLLSLSSGKDGGLLEEPVKDIITLWLFKTIFADNLRLAVCKARITGSLSLDRDLISSFGQVIGSSDLDHILATIDYCASQIDPFSFTFEDWVYVKGYDFRDKDKTYWVNRLSSNLSPDFWDNYSQNIDEILGREYNSIHFFVNTSIFLAGYFIQTGEKYKLSL